jgi:pentatricopeptide repeat protein
MSYVKFGSGSGGRGVTKVNTTQEKKNKKFTPQPTSAKFSYGKKQNTGPQKPQHRNNNQNGKKRKFNAEEMSVDEEYHDEKRAKTNLINWATSLPESWAAATPDLEAAKRKKDVVLFNKLISHFGTQKHLPLALETFNELCKCSKTWPTVYTFSALINACVRCGEIQKAKEFHQQMIDKYKLEPNEITFTTLIKGLCTLDDPKSIQEACDTLVKMREWNVYPNVRTFNTILRGCLRAGMCTTAQKM